MAISLDSPHGRDNFYSRTVKDQKFAIIPSLELESGEHIEQCPIAYKTWGTLNETRDNVLVICHAMTGSSDVSDWWSPLIGPGKAIDPTRFFVFSANVLGSPYGSASSLTVNPATGRPYAAEFPQTSIRDDIHAQKRILDAFGVRTVAAVIGGSMGGMAVLEWPLCTPQGYVKNIIPIATAANHSAWCISWAETQRQCIWFDPAFKEGYYEATPEGQPVAGLTAARMIAMLTYRSYTSFDARFGRKPQSLRTAPSNVPMDLPRTDAPVQVVEHGARKNSSRAKRRTAGPMFSAQGYLQYQGGKFLQRFDANCYLHILEKMDSHDVTLGRTEKEGDEGLEEVLARAPPGALVIGVATDALFLPEQQELLANYLPDSTLVVLDSSHGHDGFLLEFEHLNSLIEGKLKSTMPHLYESTDSALDKQSDKLETIVEKTIHVA